MKIGPMFRALLRPLPVLLPLVLTLSILRATPGHARDVPKVPPEPSKRVYVRKTIQVKRTLDLKGRLYVWKGEKPRGQKEGQPPMFRVVRPGVGIKNGHILNAPDGIHLSAPGAYVDRIVFRNIVEDAVTIEKDDCVVKRSQFFNAEDKAIQHNAGDNARIEKNVFVNCAKSYRLPDKLKKKVEARFTGNKIYRRGQVHTESSRVHLILEDNVWHGVRRPVFNKDSRITEKGNRSLWFW
jgi:hypothetical protein